jgi:hypothetical protein
MFVNTVAISNCLAPSVGVYSINSIVTKSIIGLEAPLWTKSHHKQLSQSLAFSCDGIRVRFWVTYVQICGCMMQIGTEVWKRDTLVLLICLKLVLHAWQLQPSKSFDVKMSCGWMMQAGTAEVPTVTLYSYFRSSCAWRVRLGLLLKGMSHNLWLHFNFFLLGEFKMESCGLLCAKGQLKLPSDMPSL